MSKFIIKFSNINGDSYYFQSNENDHKTNHGRMVPFYTENAVTKDKEKATTFNSKEEAHKFISAIAYMEPIEDNTVVMSDEEEDEKEYEYQTSLQAWIAEYGCTIIEV